MNYWQKNCKALLRGIFCIRKHNNILSHNVRHAHTISVPKRIHRSSTDILKALESTVGVDLNAPHYKFHDDPFLIPGSNLTKRSYALSKESGRKSARWIRDKHRKFFNHQPDDPIIKEFLPKSVFDENSDVSQDTLAELIEDGDVSNAVTVYELCQVKSIDLSEELKLSLLQFLCFYNCTEPLNEDWVEEQWYSQNVERPKKTWQDRGLAEELFDSLTLKDSVAYCSLIRGMCKFYQVDRAVELFTDARAKNISLDTGTYNAMIAVIPFLREGSENRWELALEYLKLMESNGISPNIGTLNSTLTMLSQAGAWRQAKALSLQITSEFKRIGIKPSLASYFHLLRIHCRDRGPISNILTSILKEIEGQEFIIVDLFDTHFFVTAMNVCTYHIKDYRLAQEVHSLLNLDKNYKLIGDSFKESIYYRNYFILACNSETAEKFMEIYNDLVPHTYVPEPRVIEEIVKMALVHDSFHLLPQLWSDSVIFGYTQREKLLCVFLSAVCKYEVEFPDDLSEKFIEIVWDIWKTVQLQPEDKHNKLVWSGQMMSDLIRALILFDDNSKFSTVIKEVDYENILGTISSEALVLANNYAIEKNDSHASVLIVTYAENSGLPEASQMAKVSLEKLTHPVAHEAKLTVVLKS